MIPILTAEDMWHKISAKKWDHQKNYLAMYSSWIGGITKTPALMTLPVDDHMVHRGDGIFEAFKAVEGKLYLLDAHLDRLQKSAERIQLKLRWSKEELKDIILQTGRAAEEKNLLFRFYVSRGPGGFSTNPYESVGPQLYIVATRLGHYPPQAYQQGVKIGTSHIPIKDSWLAQVKSCNYLTNVMMKKEAVDRQLDFTVSFTKEGLLGEGSTENIAVVSKQGELLFPSFMYTLRGTTLLRLEELSPQLVKDKLIKKMAEAEVGREDLKTAREILLVGTTLDVLPVKTFDDQAVGSGQVGPVARRALELILADQRQSRVQL